MQATFHRDGGGYYWSDGERRTFTYQTPAAAENAWDNGERMTPAEHAERTTVNHSAQPSAARRMRTTR